MTQDAKNQPPAPAMVLTADSLAVLEIPTPNGTAPMLTLATDALRAHTSILLTPDTCRTLIDGLERFATPAQRLEVATSIPDLPPANGRTS